jgi:phage baseplate assembly protein W
MTARSAIGMQASTGVAINGVDHLMQSIHTILTTPVGSRVMRRSFGSLLPELIDQPDNAATRVRVFAAVAGALMRWEPRLRISRVQLASGAPRARPSWCWTAPTCPATARSSCWPCACPCRPARPPDVSAAP